MWSGSGGKRRGLCARQRRQRLAAGIERPKSGLTAEIGQILVRCHHCHSIKPSASREAHCRGEMEQIHTARASHPVLGGQVAGEAAGVGVDVHKVEQSREIELELRQGSSVHSCRFLPQRDANGGKDLKGDEIAYEKRTTTPIEDPAHRRGAVFGTIELDERTRVYEQHVRTRMSPAAGPASPNVVRQCARAGPARQLPA